MGVILCEIHGRQGMASVCPHVAERYHHASDADGIFAVRGKYIDSLDEMVLFWCCAQCALQNGFGVEQPIDYLEVAEDFLGTLKPMCYVCFEAWLEGKD